MPFAKSTLSDQQYNTFIQQTQPGAAQRGPAPTYNDIAPAGNTAPLTCVPPKCAPLSYGCTYLTGTETFDAQGCRIDCGQMRCENAADTGGTSLACPRISCPTPAIGCAYDTSTVQYDASGCPKDCGKMVCEDRGGGAVPAACTPPPCAAPLPGCMYDKSTIVRDANGCQLTCGNIVCDTPDRGAPPTYNDVYTPETVPPVGGGSGTPGSFSCASGYTQQVLDVQNDEYGNIVNITIACIRAGAPTR